MKLLLLGNSQAACLKLALEKDPGLLPADCEVSYYVTPGGTGPYFTIENGKLNGRTINPALPAYFSPDSTPETPMSAFDVIFISALGYVDGGHAFLNPAIQQGLLHAFDPVIAEDGDAAPQLVSQACYRAAVEAVLVGQHGMRLLRDLRANFAGRIWVQRFPQLSQAITDRADWRLRLSHRDPVGMHRFLAETRDTVLERLAAELDLDLLAYPDLGADGAFTPAHLMGADCVHPTPDYGAMVWRLVADRIEAPHAQS